MKKRIIILLTALLMTLLCAFSLNVSVSAVQGLRETIRGEDVNRIIGRTPDYFITEAQHQLIIAEMDSWDTLNAQRMLFEAEGNDTKEIEAEMKAIDNRIKSLGGVILSQDQVNLLYNSVSNKKSPDSPNMEATRGLPSIPPSTSHTKWTASGPVSTVYNGVTYKVYHIIAQSLNGIVNWLKIFR